MNTEQEYFESNRSLWNEKTKHHVVSDFYDMKGFLAGNTSLNEIELELLGDVSGKSIVHLQCHFGQDSLSLSRMGANVLGTDISDDAIAFAEKTAAELKLNARFLRADTYSVAEKVDEKFDIVYASYGVIGWLPDLKRFAETVSKLLKPGGQFIFAESHTMIWMFDYDFTKITYSYFNNGPIVETIEGTYTDRAADIKMKEIGWNHSIADLLQSLIDAGLSIEVFKEYDYSPYNCYKNSREVSKGKWQINGLEGVIPMVYSLKATKRK